MVSLGLLEHEHGLNSNFVVVARSEPLLHREFVGPDVLESGLFRHRHGPRRERVDHAFDLHVGDVDQRELTRLQSRELEFEHRQKKPVPPGVAGPVPLPTRKNTFTVIKSPHVYKKGGEHFEMRIHKRLIDITNPTPKTIDSLQNLSLPAGCDAEIRM